MSPHELSATPEIIAPTQKQNSLLEFCKEALNKRCWGALDRELRTLPVGSSKDKRILVEKYHQRSYVEIWVPGADSQNKGNKLQQIDIVHEQDGTIQEICQTLTTHDSNGFPRVDIARCARMGTENSLEPKDALWTLRYGHNIFTSCILSGQVV